MSDADIIRRLSERVAELEETLRQERETRPTEADLAAALQVRLALTPQRARLLAMLARARHGVTYDDAMASLDSQGKRDVLHVMLVGVRRALRAHGVRIDTVWGHGFRIDAEGRARVLALVGMEQGRQR